MNIRQAVENDRRLYFCGDVIRFVLEVEGSGAGFGMLRTNLGSAEIRRREVIEKVEDHRPEPGRNWRDVPMIQVSPTRWEVILPLLEVGSFEAKCYWSSNGKTIWPPGENLLFKVDPADMVCANTLYTAFVRQFGQNIASDVSVPGEDQAVTLLENRNYTVIPQSGTFRALIEKLDFIFQELGTRILQLLPIHPVPTTFARMGRYGSPFAALDYFAINPAFIEFDRKATPLEQFHELVDAVHLRRGKVFMDIPVNHTGWASKLQQEHPDWFVRQKDGSVVSPGAWGVVWEDLCKLDYSKVKVWKFMAEVFLYWCQNGVDGFRCDAGYMLPEESWEYIVSRVREEYPDTIFLLEGLGGPLDKQNSLLLKRGLNWAYSELFQNYSRSQIEYEFNRFSDCSRRCGVLVHYAETHDNLRLAAKSKTYAKMRCALSIALSFSGCFGITNGVEWFATERFDVHGAPSLNWGAADNMVAFLKRLQTLVRIHDCFYPSANIRLVETGAGNSLAVLRTSSVGRRLLILVNLDSDRANPVSVPVAEFPAVGEKLWDLLAGVETTLNSIGGLFQTELQPGEVRILCREEQMLKILNAEVKEPLALPDRVEVQRRRQMALTVYTHRHGFSALPDTGIADRVGDALLNDDRQCLRELWQTALPPVTEFLIGRDERRMVMVPPGDLIVFRADKPFRIKLYRRERVVAGGMGCRTADGNWMLYLKIPDSIWPGQKRVECKGEIQLGTPEKLLRSKCAILLLPPAEKLLYRTEFSASAASSRTLYALGANNLGGLAHVAASWGVLRSKYDCLLAGACNNSVPSDRHVMLPRCKAWIVRNNFSSELCSDFLLRFGAGNKNCARWEFCVPVGQGKLVRVNIDMRFACQGDAVRYIFSRLAGDSESDESVLPDSEPVELILRPAVDDRINHEVTKAYAGAEKSFPAAVRADADGFTFAPYPDRKLCVKMKNATFVREPEWEYMVFLEREHDYGLEDHTDLFSPGYFRTELVADTERALEAEIKIPDSLPVLWGTEKNTGASLSGLTIAEEAMKKFIVKRDAYASVIAGYPWFLDWGRDTLIALRGLIAGGFQKEARAIIQQFAAFEKDGTIPNMIRGNDDSNRDTSDAPLWLFTATADYVKAFDPEGKILQEDTGSGRTLQQALHSIVEGYRRGTPNGIRVDAGTNLVYSPAHFTWMDTNYPTGSPRQGYPIEIQALWYAALRFLSQYEPEYGLLAEQTAASIDKLFFRKDLGRFSDCLHAPHFQEASTAEADDAVRPNQLLALTLGAVTRQERKLAILRSAEELIVPGAIRSLADRPVACPLEVSFHGQLLNDPYHPYRGGYHGPEDTSRKVAYHNGTAWGWMFPSYVEAYFLTGGEEHRARASALLASARELFEEGVVGQLPEVLDGDRPHKAGGCDAQAWSVTEFYRVGRLLFQDQIR